MHALRTLVRKVRGLIGVGLTWGALWSVIGAGVGLVIGVLTGSSLDTDPLLRWGVGLGLYGLVSGAAFGALLALTERRGSVFDLPLPRAALWGVAGAAGVPLLFGALGMFPVGTNGTEVLAAIAITAALGGISAPTSIGIARRAELRETEGIRPLNAERPRIKSP